MTATDQARWFSQQVLPCEPALRAYLLKRFPALPDHDDLLQEVYVRTLKAQESGRVACTRAFLFTAARNAAIDQFRRQRRVSNEELSEAVELELLSQSPDATSATEKEQHLEVLLEAILALPDRCRQVMMLRHLDGLSYKDIAARLGISPETVKVHMIKGVKDCTRFFHDRGLLAGTESPDEIAS